LLYINKNTVKFTLKLVIFYLLCLLVAVAPDTQTGLCPFAPAAGHRSSENRRTRSFLNLQTHLNCRNILKLLTYDFFVGST